MGRYHHRRVPTVPDEQVRAFIVDYLKRCPDNEQSISYLILWVREHDIRVPTRLSDAEDTFTRLGFTLRRECNKYGAILRTYVQLGANHGEESRVQVKQVSFEEVTCKFPKSCEWPECYCSADEGS
jgi:hypothetical protein